MSIRFIYGRSGTGKSTFCIDDIKKKLNNKEDNKLILLVPDQYTFSTENKILRSIGEPALLRTEVLSFKKMAHLVFDEYGGRVKELIKESGKNMLIHRVLEENIESLNYFQKISREQGFNEIVLSIIREFKKYNLDIDKLREIIPNMQESELSKKLEELSIIYEQFNLKMHNGYIDGDDELTLLIKKLSENNIYKNSEIWIDEFTTFTPQQLEIIRILSKQCKRINITLCMDGSSIKNEYEDITYVFNTTKNTENKIVKIMKENNIGYDKPIDLNNDNPYRFKDSKELKHIEKYFFAYPFNAYNGENKDVTLYKANNIYDEVDRVAKSIVELVRDRGYRYRDISVVCRNIDDYEKIISVIFNDYDIPYFMDKKLKLLSNPLIISITSAFEISFKNWSYESVFKYLKSGLTGIDVNYIDMLENFILEHGIKGYKWTVEDILSDKWFNNQGEELSEEKIFIAEIMEEIRKPLIKFHNKINGQHIVKDICKAVYEFLVDIEAFQRIDLWIEKFEEINLENKVKEYSQVEKIVIDILDQAVDVIGDEKIDSFEFFKILNSGFSNEDIGVIPVALDQVNIGDVARIRGREVKVLCIVGINDGVLPSSKKEEGILSDRDRGILNEMGIALASDTRTKVFEEQFLLYTVLTISSEYLMLSYPMADFEGKSLRPSIVIPRIKKILPNLVEESSIYDLRTKENKFSKVVSPIPTFNELILALRRDFDKEDIEDYWPEVYNWFKENDIFEEKVKNIFKGLTYSNVGDKVAKAKLRELYQNDMGNLVFSVSRLEKYAECPFSYFIQYGLKAKNRKIYEFTPPDLGSFVHEILDLFTNKVKDEGILWSELNNEKCKNIVSNIIDKRLEESNSILNSTKKYKYLAKRFKRVISKSVSVISEQINKGEFEVFKTEFNFGSYNTGEAITLDLSQNEKIYLQGRIDRIDTLDLDGSTYLRIIDYKTGAKKFDLNELYYGLQMQLLVYLDALIKNSKYILNKQVRPGAVLYFKIDDPIIKIKKQMTTEEIEKEVLDALKMKGLVLKDAKVVKAMDKDIEGYSLVIPASFKKDGDFKSNSDVITEDEFNLLRKYVNKKMTELCEEMLSGDIKIEPTKNSNRSYCEYCDFSSICQFDTNIKDNNYNIIIKKSEEEIWTDIKKEIVD